MSMSLEAKNSLISDLEQRQAELETAIKDAVRNGSGSAQFRRELKEVLQQLQTARSSVAAAEALASQKAAQQIAPSR